MANVELDAGGLCKRCRKPLDDHEGVGGKPEAVKCLWKGLPPLQPA